MVDVPGGCRAGPALYRPPTAARGSWRRPPAGDGDLRRVREDRMCAVRSARARAARRHPPASQHRIPAATAAAATTDCVLRRGQVQFANLLNCECSNCDRGGLRPLAASQRGESADEMLPSRDRRPCAIARCRATFSGEERSGRSDRALNRVPAGRPVRSESQRQKGAAKQPGRSQPDGATRQRQRSPRPRLLQRAGSTSAPAHTWAREPPATRPARMDRAARPRWQGFRWQPDRAKGLLAARALAAIVVGRLGLRLARALGGPPAAAPAPETMRCRPPRHRAAPAALLADMLRAPSSRTPPPPPPPPRSRRGAQPADQQPARDRDHAPPQREQGAGDPRRCPGPRAATAQGPSPGPGPAPPPHQPRPPRPPPAAPGLRHQAAGAVGRGGGAAARGPAPGLQARGLCGAALHRL
jgi:hypothetical protein